jgi:nitrile hydratase accessory protein
MAEHAPRPEPERVFGAPWHAHVFAFAVKLSQAGHFTWSEWGEHFGAHLRRAAAADDSAADPRPMPEVDSATYYDVWLDALESLLIQRGLASAADLAELKEAWTEAYLHTPHGMPVELGGNGDHIHAHSHVHAED